MSDSFQVIEEALRHWGTWRMQNLSRERALISLASLREEWERLERLYRNQSNDLLRESRLREQAEAERDEHQRIRGLLFRDLERSQREVQRLREALEEIERADCRPLLGRLMGPMDPQGIARRALGEGS